MSRNSPQSQARPFVWRPFGLSIVIDRRTAIVTVGLFFVATAIGIAALTVGTLPIGLGQAIAAIGGQDVEPRIAKVVLDLRVPRVLTAALAGAALGVSGAIFQSVSRNAMGSPDIIGFTTGAATGAIVQIVLFQAEPLFVSLGAISGGLLTGGLVYLLSRKGGVTGGYRLVLVGIGVGAVLAALNGLLLVKGDLDDAISANLWLSGSLDARKWAHALPLLVGTVLLVPVASYLARRASLIEMGDDLAQQLGVRVERTRLLLMVTGVLLAALATGAAGPIAFVALAAPQIVLRLTKSNGVPIWSSAAMGAALLLAADVLTQTLPITAAIPIGRMTGIIGGIYLIWLLTRAKQV